jgi:polyisoprenoid-binding protein YceI
MTTATAAPTTTRWTIDSTHSSVEFAVRHLMIATVRGRFADVQGTLTLPDDDPLKAEVEVTIKADSIDTRVEQRDAHLRSSDFFDAERFPALTFKSRRVLPSLDGGLQLVGDLTIRGTTREVILDVTSHGRQRDPWKGERAGFEATTKIRRSDFGLSWNQVLETGGVAVSDEVKISLDVELLRQ